MNLHAMLLQREAAGRPVTVGLIGAGKFGTMFMTQVRRTRGMHLVGIADLDVAHARAQLSRAGWSDEAFSAASLNDALRRRATHVGADAEALITCPEIEVIVEATGIPEAGIRHALTTIAHGKHIVMVNVEADAVAGPLLARKARAANVVYSLAWGDQPALICEHVDWARTCVMNMVPNLPAPIRPTVTGRPAASRCSSIACKFTARFLRPSTKQNDSTAQR